MKNFGDLLVLPVDPDLLGVAEIPELLLLTCARWGLAYHATELITATAISILGGEVRDSWRAVGLEREPQIQSHVSSLDEGIRPILVGGGRTASIRGGSAIVGLAARARRATKQSCKQKE